MMDKTSSSSGIGTTGVLCIVFVVLKLCHVIHWSWWWVLSPIWITIVVALLLFVVLVAVKRVWS